MISKQKMPCHIGKMIGLLTAGAALTACVSNSTTPDIKSAANLQQDGQALLIVDSHGQNCDNTKFTFENIETGKNTRVSIIEKGRRNTVPAVFDIPAGSYRLTKGQCIRSGFQPIHLGDLELWFDEFEVSPGDTRYLGSMFIGAINEHIERSAASRALNAVIAWNFASKDLHQFKVYQFLDRKSEAKARLEALFPGTDVEFDMAPPPARITPREYGAVISNAFEDNPDGSRRTTAQARAAIAAGLAEFKDDEESEETNN